MESSRDGKRVPHPENADLAKIFENAFVGICLIQDGAIRTCNRRTAEIFGIGEFAARSGMRASAMHPSPESYEALNAAAWAQFAKGDSFSGEWELAKVDGTTVWCRLFGNPLDTAHPDQGTIWVVEDIGDWKRAEAALQESRALLDDTLEFIDQGISIFDQHLIGRAFSRRFHELHGIPPALSTPGTPFETFIHYNATRGDYGPGDTEEQIRSRVELARRFDAHHFERERADGTVLEIRGTPIPGRGFITTYTDITQRKQAERALRESEARFRSLTALSSDWYWEQDADFRFTRLEGRHVTGDAAAFAAELGLTHWDLGFEIEGGWESHRATLAAHQAFKDAVMQRRFPDGVIRFVRVSGEPVSDATGAFIGYRGVGRDVTDQKVAEERVQYLATHDGLTGLPNRVMFSQLLNSKILTARRYGGEFAILFIDLDRFKLVNDSLGHEAGDALLKTMASRFRECLRESDVVARLGGDEFVILLQQASDAEDVSAVARKVLAMAKTPVSIGGKECRVSGSIGICRFPKDATDEQALMRHADAAMYKSKSMGKNAFSFYTSDLETQSLERLSLEANLRHALQRNEFSLDYQAKLDLLSGTVSGVEALLRWQQPDLGSVPPMKFLPLAEEIGLATAIGQWVLRSVCVQWVNWHRAGVPPVCISVNVSAHQFKRELIGDVRAALHESGMDAAYLQLELNEATLLADPERAAQLLKALKEIGVRIAIDDFGIGYSTIGQIEHFAVDTVKLDRSFVQDIGRDEHGQSMVQAIIAMGKTLSLTVVANCVETPAQQEFLRRHACDEIQGYHFSKPASPSVFADLLKQQGQANDA